MNTTDIWNTLYTQLNGFVLKRVKNEEVTKDLLQEVFIKIHNNIQSLQDEEKLTSWVYQITRNIINDYYRKHQVSEDLPENLPQDQNLEIEEMSTCLICLINDLPKEYKRPLFLSEIKGIPQTEVAKKLNLSYPATKSRVQRGRKLLKDKLQDCDPDSIVFGTEACRPKE